MRCTDKSIKGCFAHLAGLSRCLQFCVLWTMCQETNNKKTLVMSSRLEGTRLGPRRRWCAAGSPMEIFTGSMGQDSLCYPFVSRKTRAAEWRPFTNTGVSRRPMFSVLSILSPEESRGSESPSPRLLQPGAWWTVWASGFCIRVS